MNHINDPEWLDNLEDIKLHGTGHDDINLIKNFQSTKKELVKQLREKAELEKSKSAEFIDVTPQETYA